MNSRALPLLGIIVAVLIFFGYVNPMWKGPIATTKAAIASNNAALSAARAYEAQQSQLTAARSSIDPAALARLTSFLPDSVDNVRIILDLDALAGKSGLVLSNINVAQSQSSSGSGTSNASGASAIAQPGAAGSMPGAGAAGARGTQSTQQGNQIGSIDLTLTAVGTYASLITFLNGIERSGRLLDLQTLSVSGSSSGAYSYQMTVRLYWLR